MSDPRPLRDETESEFSRALLDSVRSDGPTSGARERALRAFGLASATVAAATTVSTAAKAGTAVAGSNAGSLVAAVVGSGMMKWVGMVGVGSAVAAVSIHYARTRAHPVLSHPIAMQPAVASPADTAPTNALPFAIGATPPDPPAPLPSSATPPSSTSTRMHPPPSASPMPPVLPASALQQQTEMLDSARASLENGDTRGALAQLDRIDHRFKAGELGEEAVVLRIEALHASGDRAASAALARRFLAEHPRSAYAQRVRSAQARP